MMDDGGRRIVPRLVLDLQPVVSSVAHGHLFGVAFSLLVVPVAKEAHERTTFT